MTLNISITEICKIRVNIISFFMDEDWSAQLRDFSLFYPSPMPLALCKLKDLTVCFYQQLESCS